MTIKEAVKDLIVERFSSLNYHVGKTAKSLGISVRCLRNKLREYGFEPHYKSLKDKKYLESISHLTAEQRDRFLNTPKYRK